MKTTSAEALAFLDRHRLPPTPQNYTLAYIALDEPTSRIGLAVKAIAEDGVRIRQEEADEIVALYAGDSIRHGASDGEEERSRLQDQAGRTMCRAGLSVAIPKAVECVCCRTIALEQGRGAPIYEAEAR